MKTSIILIKFFKEIEMRIRTAPIKSKAFVSKLVLINNLIWIYLNKFRVKNPRLSATKIMKIVNNSST